MQTTQEQAGSSCTVPVRHPSTTIGRLLSTTMTQFVIFPALRNQYGMPDLEIIASNNPKALFGFSINEATRYPHHKLTFVCANERLTRCWKNMLGAAIVQTIQSNLPVGATWVLNVLRLGFDDEPAQNPIVIHLVVDTKHFSDSAASQLVTILRTLVDTHWRAESGDENVAIDICRVVLRSAKCSVARDQSIAFASLYKQELPLPGSSIGADQHTGTLTGYVKHGLPDGTFEVFALTCRHVVDAKEKITYAGHLRPGNPIVVSSPSPEDHIATKNAIGRKIRRYKLLGNSQGSSLFGSIVTAFSSLVSAVTSLVNSRLVSSVALVISPVAFSVASLISTIISGMIPNPKHHWYHPVEFWSEVKLDAENYNIELGTVSATSGPRNLDWALIPIALGKIKNIDLLNQHFPLTMFDEGSGFQCAPFTNFPDADVEAAEQHFYLGPSFLPIRQTPLARNEVCFKPPSRTTRQWMGAQLNDIRTIVKTPIASPITLYCFVAAVPVRRAEVAAKGDSGSVILGRDFHVAGMLWGGIDAARGVPDVTLAIPILEIFADIEKTLAWAEGSVTFC